MTAELLLLLPQSFPFGFQSDFLKEEIGHLAKAFRTVRLAPYAPRGPAQTVPSNVIVDLDLARRVASRRQRVVASLATSHGRRLLSNELRSRSQPRRHPQAFAHLAAASGLASETRRWINRLGPLPPTTLGMTVWLGPATVGLHAAGIRTVSRAHRGDLFESHAPHAYLPLQREELLACEWVMSVSDAGRDELRRRFPELADRCVTRRLGVSGARTLATASTDGVVRVVSCSALVPVKRPLLLVEVIRALSRNGTPVEWRHFGSGPLWEQFNAAARTLPAQVVMPGHVENNFVVQHYESQPVDVFLNVSESEGVPVSMMEAISAGIPVVATDVGGVAEIVDGTAGTVVSPAAEPITIARAMVDELARDRVGRRAEIRAVWQERYSARHNYAEFAAELAGLAGAGGP